MSYDAWKLRSDLDDAEMHGRGDGPEPEFPPLYCAGCNGFIPEGEKAYPAGGRRWLCEDCHHEQPQVIAGLEQAAAWDRERK